jgi:4-hydroxybenzoate polyprenyltransferase
MPLIALLLSWCAALKGNSKAFVLPLPSAAGASLYALQWDVYGKKMFFLCFSCCVVLYALAIKGGSAA